MYCKDTNRTGKYPIYKFDFLGYTFRPRRSKNRKGELFVSFSPAVSDKAAKRMRRQIRRWRIHRRNDLSFRRLLDGRNQYFQVGFGTMGDFIHQHCERRFVQWTNILCAGPNVNTKGTEGNTCKYGSGYVSLRPINHDYLRIGPNESCG